MLIRLAVIIGVHFIFMFLGNFWYLPFVILFFLSLFAKDLSESFFLAFVFGLLWVGTCFYLDSEVGYNISNRFAGVFYLTEPVFLYLIVGLLSMGLGTIASISGFLLGESYLGKIKASRTDL